VYAFIIKYRNGLDSLGVYSVDTSSAMILSAISSIGFSAIIMNRIPALEAEERKKTYTRVNIQSFCVNILLLPILLILYKINFVFNYGHTFVYLIGMTCYQLYRQYLYSIADYLKVFFCELTLLFVVSIAFILFNKNLILIHGIIYCLIGGGVFILNFRKVNFLNKGEIKSGLGFGFSNISSLILSEIAAPLANQMLGVSYAGFLGLIKQIIAFVVLIPRSLSTYYVPILVKIKENYEKKRIFNRYKIINNLTLTGVLIIEILAWLLFVKLFPNSDLLLNGSTWIFIILTINSYSSQINSPYFSLFNVFDKSKLAFYLNFALLCSFLSSLLFLNAFSGVKGFILIYATISIILLIRYIFIVQLLKKKNLFNQN
jgi:O-antigen/teichoic acid export membrane protein